MIKTSVRAIDYEHSEVMNYQHQIATQIGMGIPR
jgi:hypothetical protein